MTRAVGGLFAVAPADEHACITSLTWDSRVVSEGALYVALPGGTRTSGTTEAHAVSKRMALRLEREGLAQFDEPDFPTAVTLTPDGVVLAEQLRAAYAAKARAA